MTERYVELRCQSAFSFLRGASLPEDLVEEAARLGYSALGLGDRDGVYGAPRFFRAAKDAGIRPLVGAEVCSIPVKVFTCWWRTARATRTFAGCSPEPSSAECSRRAADAGPWVGKRAAGVSLDDLVPHVEGLFCLAGGTSGPLGVLAMRRDAQTARQVIGRLQRLFGERLAIDLQRHLDPREERRNRFLVDLARANSVPLVASPTTCAMRSARAARLLDVLTCIRDQHDARRCRAGACRQRRAPCQDARRDGAPLSPTFPRPSPTRARSPTRCEFTLADLGYQFPDYPLPPGRHRRSVPAHADARRCARRYASTDPITTALGSSSTSSRSSRSSGSPATS